MTIYPVFARDPVVVALVLSSLLLIVQRYYAKSLRSILRTTASSEPHATILKAKYSEPFTFPGITPCPEPVQNIKPVPYRPFRWVDYHVTMGIQNIPFESWIELDNQYEMYHRLRTHRAKELGSRVIQTLPPDPAYQVSGYEAAKELVHELAEYLSRRYPLNFSVERHPLNDECQRGWYDEGAIRTITVKEPVDVTYDLDEEDPMTVAGLLVQDDLALMIKGPNDMYYFRAGAICTAGSWTLEEKLGMSIDDIHLSGNVPQYPQKLQKSLNRFFLKLTVDRMVRRNNYSPMTIAGPSRPLDPLDPYEIAWSETLLGKEEDHKQGRGHASETSSEAGAVTPDMMQLRMERQTLRRLPKTGAVVFTIRSYVVALEELAKEVGVPGRMASAIRSWPEDVAGYKARVKFEQLFLSYLDEQHRKQVEEGLISADEQPRTDYPF